jgi:hypothetical protein
MSRVCRALPIGADIGDSFEMALRNWLAVLLPLNLPGPSGDLADPINALVRRTATELDPITRELLAAAEGGLGSVAARLHALIAEPFADLDQGVAQ